jgi:hypothetical protein
LRKEWAERVKKRELEGRSKEDGDADILPVSVLSTELAL